MRKSNFGSSSGQRQSVLKPRNTDNTPNNRLSSNMKKYRGSSEGVGNTRLSQMTGRFTPLRSNIPRYTPVRNGPPGSSQATLQVPSSASRLSMDSVRNSSMGAKNRKETRPIGDTAFKTECIDKVLEFLACYGFDGQVNRRSLLNPSAKEFTNIFSFIYRHFDPSYTLPQKFEEEIPRLMKLMKYPSQLSKSTFISVGSRHTWPVVLAMLAWMIDSLTIYNGTDTLALLFSTNFDLDSSTAKKRLDKFVDIYACRDNVDEIEDQCEEYNHDIEHLYEVRSQDIIAIQDYNEKLENEISLVSSLPERLEQLNLQFEQLVNDKEKMICYNRELQIHITAKDTERGQLESNIAELYAKSMKINEEQVNLEAVKSNQALSASELARFKNHAKDVATLISTEKAQGKDLDSQIWALEINLGKVQKELRDKISSYNSLHSQLDLDDHFKIESNNVAENVKQWKNELLPELYECKKNAKHVTFEIQNKKSRKKEELDMVEEILKEKKDELSKLESKVRRLEESITMTKTEILNEEKEMQQENDRLHQQIIELRKSNKASLYQKQYSVDQAKEELEAIKSYGKTRMRSGAEFLIKVCNRAVEDLDFKNNAVLLFKQDVKKCCKEVVDLVKSNNHT